MSYRAGGPYGQGPFWMRGSSSASSYSTPIVSGLGLAMLVGCALVALMGYGLLVLLGPTVHSSLLPMLRAAMEWAPGGVGDIAAAAAKGAVIGWAATVYRRWRSRSRYEWNRRGELFRPSMVAGVIGGIAVGIAAATLGLLLFSPEPTSLAGGILRQSGLLIGGGGAGGEPPDATFGPSLAALLQLVLALMAVGAVVALAVGAGLGAVASGAVIAAAEASARAAVERVLAANQLERDRRAARLAAQEAVRAEERRQVPADPEGAEVWLECRSFPPRLEYAKWLRERGRLSWRAVIDSMPRYEAHLKEHGLVGSLPRRLQTLLNHAQWRLENPGPLPESHRPVEAPPPEPEPMPEPQLPPRPLMPTRLGISWKHAKDAAASGALSGAVAAILGAHLLAALGDRVRNAQAMLVICDILTAIGASITIAVLRRLVRDSEAVHELFRTIRVALYTVLVLFGVGMLIYIVQRMINN